MTPWSRARTLVKKIEQDVADIRGELHTHDRIIEANGNAISHHAKQLGSRITALEDRAEHAQHHSSVPLPIRGCDYAFGHPRGTALLADGFRWVGRYYGGETAKDLTLSEAQQLAHEGIHLVSIFEASGVAEGHESGLADGRRALDEARGCHQPEHAPIIFANDREDIAGLLEYLHAAAGVIAPYPVGVYGGIDAIEAAAKAGVRWLYQTAAWSRGRWSPHAQIHQLAAQTVCDGVTVDVDEAVTIEHGQWTPLP
jgi:hypothetical protein